jgi:hypothetical protein
MAESEEQYYVEKCSPFQTVIDGLLEKETALLAASKENPANAAGTLFGLSDDMLNLASHYLILNGLSLTILKNRNEEALNEARKTLYKAVIYLENIVSAKVNAPYSDYGDRVKSLAAAVNEQQRLDMVKKMGLAVSLLKNAYGNHSKWKWAFVEIEGRVAAVAKNMLELSTIITNTDPLAPAYEVTTYHIRLVKRLLANVATLYRDRYSLSTQAVDDLQNAQNFLGALRFLHTTLGEAAEAENAKKQCDLLQAKMENEHRKKTAAAFENKIHP